MFYMQHLTDAEFIRHLENGNHTGKEVQALLERLRKAQDALHEAMVAQETMDNLMSPGVSKAVVWKDGTTHVALYGAEDWEAARQLIDADGYGAEREPLFWAPQFINNYERQLAIAGYPSVVYRKIDVWGKLLDQTVGQPAAPKPTLRTRTRNANTKPAEQQPARRRTRTVR